MTAEPEIAGRAPLAVDVEAGNSFQGEVRRRARHGLFAGPAAPAPAGFRLADKGDIALDQIGHLRPPGLLRREIGDVQPRRHLQSGGRRRDEQRRVCDLGIRRLRPCAGNGARRQQCLHQRARDRFHEAREPGIAYHEARVLAFGVVGQHALQSELRQRGLVFFAEIDGDAPVGVVARVPEDAHRRGGRPLAPLDVHEVGHLVRAGRTHENNYGGDCQDDGVRMMVAIGRSHDAYAPS